MTWRKLELTTEHWILEDDIDYDYFIQDVVEQNPHIQYLVFTNIFHQNPGEQSIRGHSNVTLLPLKELDRIYGTKSLQSYGQTIDLPRIFKFCWASAGKNLADQAIENPDKVYHLFCHGIEASAEIENYWNSIRYQEVEKQIRCYDNFTVHYTNSADPMYDHDTPDSAYDEDGLLPLPVSWLPREYKPGYGGDRSVMVWDVGRNRDMALAVLTSFQSYNEDDECPGPDYQVRLRITDLELQKDMEKAIKQDSKYYPWKKDRFETELVETGQATADFFSSVFGFRK